MLWMRSNSSTWACSSSSVEASGCLSSQRNKVLCSRSCLPCVVTTTDGALKRQNLTRPRALAGATERAPEQRNVIQISRTVVVQERISEAESAMLPTDAAQFGLEGRSGSQPRSLT